MSSSNSTAAPTPTPTLTSTETMSSSTSPSSSADTLTSSVSSTTPSSVASSTSIDTSSIASSVSSVVSSEIESSSSTPPSTSSDAESTSAPPVTTSTTIAPTTRPATTIVSTSVVEVPASGTNSASQVTVIVTATNPATTQDGTTLAVTSHSSSTTSGGAAANTGGSNNNSGSGGLSTAGVTAVAVVVPVAVVALLVLAGIFFWRKRKQKKAAEEARRKEVEDYGFNPNNDPTLPTVASESGQEMSEDHSSGYRGWGAATGSNRKMSTTLSGGHTQGQLSDVGSSAYRGGPNSPTHGSDGHSGDPLVNQRRETMSSDEIGQLGQAPVAGAGINHGMKRGPSNASSTYSAGGAPSETSDGVPPNGLSQSYEAYNPNTGFGYSQHGPYGDGTYGGGAENGMPIVRDVSARRNTRIQPPGNYGNSGIAQNF